MFLEFCNYTGRMQTYVDYRPCADSHGEGATSDVCIQFSVSICMLFEIENSYVSLAAFKLQIG